MITGRLRDLHKDDEKNESNTIIKRSDAMQMQVVTAENHFVNRSWKGLEEKLGQTEVGQVKEGRSGIAMEYNEEPKQN